MTRLRAGPLALLILGLSTGMVRAQDLSPAQAAYVQALSAYGKLDLPEALRLFRQAAAFDPGSANAYLGIGNCLYQAHDLQGSLGAFREAYRLAPSESVLRFINQLESQVPAQPAAASTPQAASQAASKPAAALPPLPRYDRPRDGFYLSLYMPYNSLWGQFNGESILTAPSEVVLVPSLEDDYGLGLTLGLKGRGFLRKLSQGLALELDYNRSIHDTRWKELTGDSQYQEASLQWRVAIPPRDALHVELAGGGGWANLLVKGSATDGSTVFDANLTGWQAGLGVGLSYQAGPMLSLATMAWYRFRTFSRLDSGAGSGSILGGGLNGGGPSVRIGLSFYPPR